MEDSPAAKHPRISSDQMLNDYVVRFDDLKQRGIPLMFIDSILPGHQRMNYAVIGDTASENPEFAPRHHCPAQISDRNGVCRAWEWPGPSHPRLRRDVPDS